MVFAALLGGFAQTSMNTILPEVVNDFGIALSSGQWFITIYLLVIGITIPLVSFFANKFNTKYLFLVALFMYVLGSFACFMSPGFALMFIGRVMQAAATGIILPLQQIYVMTMVPPKKRGFVMGILGVSFGFAPTAGPTIAGVFEVLGGWRASFAFLGVFSLVIFVAALLFFDKSSQFKQISVRFDLASIVLSSLGFGGLILTISNLTAYSFTHVFVWAPAVVGVVTLVWFFVRQTRLEQPFLDIRAFTNSQFRIGAIMLCLLFMAFQGVNIVVPLYVQAYRGFSPLESGLVFLPSAAIMLFASPLAGKILDIKGPRFTITTAFIVTALGTGCFCLVGETTPLWALAIFQAIRAIGIASSNMSTITWALSSLKPERMADGTATLNALCQVFAALGVSMAALIMYGVSGNPHHVSLMGYQMAFVFSFVLTAALVLITMFKRKKFEV